MQLDMLQEENEVILDKVCFCTQKVKSLLMYYVNMMSNYYG